MSWDIVPEMLTAIAVMLGVLWQGMKTRADVAKIQNEIQPNSGKSLRDAVLRIEATQKDQTTSIEGIRNDARYDRDALITLQKEKINAHDEINHRLRNLDRKIETLKEWTKPDEPPG